MMPNTIVTRSPSVKHSTTIVFLHGFEETGDIWSRTLEQLRKPHTKLVCPTANKIPYTIYKGFNARSWFDISSYSESGIIESSFLRAVDTVHNMLDEELFRTKISSKKILLGGFSQGGTLAMYAALTYHKPLAGVIALSSWLPFCDKVTDAVTNNTDIPFLQCHGSNDSVIALEHGLKAANILKNVVAKHELIVYQGLDHCTNKELLKDVKTFIHKVLS